jgi:hypothetical protein
MNNEALAAKLAIFIARKADLETRGLHHRAAAYDKWIAKMEATLRKAPGKKPRRPRKPRLVAPTDSAA